MDTEGAVAKKADRKAANLWNVRGVDEAHRAMAKEAAEKCDMTLGRWLTEVIEKLAPMGKEHFRIVFDDEAGHERAKLLYQLDPYGHENPEKISENPATEGRTARVVDGQFAEVESQPPKGRAQASTPAKVS